MTRALNLCCWVFSDILEAEKHEHDSGRAGRIQPMCKGTALQCTQVRHERIAIEALLGWIERAPLTAAAAAGRLSAGYE